MAAEMTVIDAPPDFQAASTMVWLHAGAGIRAVSDGHGGWGRAVRRAALRGRGHSRNARCFHP